jgi:Putative peptidoglycan binding domain
VKTKFYWVALLASAAMIAQAKAGGHYGGGGGGGFAMAAHPAPAHAAAPAFQSAARGNFGGGRYIAPGTHVSSYYGPTTFRQQRLVGPDRTFSRPFATRTTNRRLDGSRTVNGRESRFIRNGNDFRNRLQNRGSNIGREHVFARRSADWHRDWDRRRDHWWHGHRCHFVNGFWFIYDTGFYPYDYWYPYGYGYYASDYYYPYDYDPGAYENSGVNYYGQGAYGSSEQYTDFTVTAVQEQLARQGYYRGEIDGIFGAETRRAVVRYQSDQGLRVTGNLNADTLRALELQRVASNQQGNQEYD